MKKLNNHNLKKEINEIKIILKPLNEYIQKEKKRKKKEEDKNNILNKVKKMIVRSKTVTFNLIFKLKTRDVYTTDIFHGFYDNKGKTLIMIETTKERKFSGFINEN